MRRGFTLVELLIVIGVIAVLAGLLFPALGLVKKQANDIKCGSNLRQIATALEVYRQNNNDLFPLTLKGTLSGGEYQLPAKIFLCPFDLSRGQDSHMGRNPIWDTQNDLTILYEPGSSYMNEVPSDPARLSANDLGFFWRDRATPPLVTDIPPPTRADGKANQLQHGNFTNKNLVGYQRFGAPFSGSIVPIIRCYHHHAWPASGVGGNTVEQALSMPARVNNVSFDFNVFKSIPWWEVALDPDL